MPGTDVPDAPCLRSLPGTAQDGVLVWPWEAFDGDAGHSQLLQLAHERPSPQRGIASWALNGDPVQPRLRGLGWRRPGPGQPPNVDWRGLGELGYRWVLVDEQADPDGAAALVELMGAPVQACGGLAAYALPEGAQAVHPAFRR